MTKDRFFSKKQQILKLSALICLISVLSSPFTVGQKLSEEDLLVHPETLRLSQLKPDILSLYSLDGVLIVIEDIQWDTDGLFLNREQIKTDIELKLRAANIRILDEKEHSQAHGQPYLRLNITPIALPDNSICMSYQLELKQSMFLDRQLDTAERMPTGYLPATTWEKGGIIFCHQSNNRMIRDCIKDKVDMLVNDFLTANPKKE